jgi:methyl-accepting chemotaxis protein
MTTDERIDAIAKTLEQTTGVVAALAGTVAAHDRQIGAILTAITDLKTTVAENANNWEQLRREWQAYLSTLPKH